MLFKLYCVSWYFWISIFIHVKSEDVFSNSLQTSSPKMSYALHWLTCSPVICVTWEETPGILTVPANVILRLAYPIAYEHNFCRTISTHSGAGNQLWQGLSALLKLSHVAAVLLLGLDRSARKWVEWILCNKIQQRSRGPFLNSFSLR